MRSVALITLVIAASISIPASARLKVVTLPERMNTTLDLSHPNLVLVTEERELPLQKGTNRVDFSWKGVQLDPDSIRLTVLKSKAQVSLINLSYPPNEQALVWEIFANRAVKQRISVSYVLENIDKQTHYEGRVSSDESSMSLSELVVLRNFSGESFEDATLLSKGESNIKISTRSGETKRILLNSAPEVSISKKYTFNAAIHPWEPDKQSDTTGLPVNYIFTNDKKHNLGHKHLNSGKIRVFQSENKPNYLFNGEDNLDDTPKGKEAEILISESKDIKVTQRITNTQKSNIKKNRGGYAVLWDEIKSYEVEIENFKDKAVTLEISEPMHGEWQVASSSVDAQVKSHNELLFTVDLKNKSKTTLTFSIKQSNVRN